MVTTDPERARAGMPKATRTGKRTWAPKEARRALLAGLLAGLWALAMPLPAAAAEAATAAADSPVVAAAADLQFALPDIATEFTRKTGRTLRLVFGSSGNFRRQIEDGAPFQLFLSADRAYVDALAREGRSADAGVDYAVGRLALIVPPGSPVKPDPELRGLARALADGTLQRFAIANPDHAPYGRAARQALERVGLWEAIRPKLVLGENVSQTAQFAVSGATQGGIVAYSLLRSPAFAGRGDYALLPTSMYDPLTQRMVLLKGAGETARAFYMYLQGPAARATLARYGFELPATAAQLR
jgi:molybdate transport system substrate-binding protein